MYCYSNAITAHCHTITCYNCPMVGDSNVIRGYSNIGICYNMVLPCYQNAIMAGRDAMTCYSNAVPGYSKAIHGYSNTITGYGMLQLVIVTL